MPNPANPQAFNRYSYVFNNPLRFTDPTGHLADGEGEWEGDVDLTIELMNMRTVDDFHHYIINNITQEEAIVFAVAGLIIVAALPEAGAIYESLTSVYGTVGSWLYTTLGPNGLRMTISGGLSTFGQFLGNEASGSETTPGQFIGSFFGGAFFGNMRFETPDNWQSYEKGPFHVCTAPIFGLAEGFTSGSIGAIIDGALGYVSAEEGIMNIVWDTAGSTIGAPVGEAINATFGRSFSSSFFGSSSVWEGVANNVIDLAVEFSETVLGGIFNRNTR